MIRVDLNHSKTNKRVTGLICLKIPYGCILRLAVDGTTHKYAS